MLQTIEKLQNASLAKRKSVAFSVSMVLTLIVFGFWLLAFVHTNTGVVATTHVIELKEQSASPFGAIRHTIGSMFGGSTSVYERE